MTRLAWKQFVAVVFVDHERLCVQTLTGWLPQRYDASGRRTYLRPIQVHDCDTLRARYLAYTRGEFGRVVTTVGWEHDSIVDAIGRLDDGEVP